MYHQDACLLPKRELKKITMICVDFKPFYLIDYYYIFRNICLQLSFAGFPFGSVLTSSGNHQQGATTVRDGFCVDFV